MKLCVLWILALSSSVASSCWRELSYGTILPRDSSFLVGSDVTLQCILSNTTLEVEGNVYNVDSSMITFHTPNKRLNTSDIEIVNSLEARFLIRNGSVDDDPYYYCGIRLNNYEQPTTICATYIYFGYPPQKVADFKCRGYKWENLTCTWKTVQNSAPVSYNLSYSVNRMFYPFFVCPQVISSKTICYWTLSTSPTYVKYNDNLFFSLTGTNELGSLTEKFSYKHFSIVVPGMPTVSVSEKEPRQVKLRIDPPSDMKLSSFPPGICYRIKYKSKYDTDFMVQSAFNVTNVTLKGLYANTWYLLNVQAKSCMADTDAEPDLWSPSVEDSFTTKPDIPESPPQALNTFFDVVNSQNSRSVTVYWQHLEDRYKNGDRFYYKVTLEQTFLHRKRRSEIPPKEVTDNRLEYRNLGLKTAYLVRIWAVNNMGASNSFTSITIPKAREMPSRPQHVRPISDGGRYEVSWVKPTKEMGNYTLVWCQGEPRCTKGLHWKVVGADTDNVVLNLVEGQYDFAVATSADNGVLGSGLEWAPCTVYRKRVYTVRQIKVDDVTPNSIRVSWKLDCEAQKAVVTYYMVYQCRCGETCLGNVSKNITDPQAESVVFDNLLPFTSYGFSVVAYSLVGHSRESDVKCVETLQSAPTDPPHNVKYSALDNTTVMVFWKPPNYPNGQIDEYLISAKAVSKPDASKNKLFSYRASNSTSSDSNNTSNDAEPFHLRLTGLKCFTNYSITVQACVKEHCSPSSDDLYVKTAIGVPGPMEPPQTTVINSSHVRVFWKAPMDANGPLNGGYRLHQFKREADNVTRLEELNITGTSVELSSGCMPHVQTEDGWTHVFSVQAVNLVPGQKEFLYGPVSNRTETKLCFMGADVNSTFVIGVIVGSTLALAVVILALYSMARWMKRKVDKMKDVKVDLPQGLQQPHSNSYQNFKNGLDPQGSDPNLSPKLGYNRDREPFNDNNDNNNSEDSFKNRHGSGASHFSASSTDELICKQNQQGGQVTAPRNMGLGGQKPNGKGERNPSGDSSSGHDSISSSLTHRTNVSTDGSTSGHEVKGRDAVSSRDSGLDEESKSLGGTTKPLPASPMDKCPYLPATAYSKLGLMGGRPGDYFPITRGRHLSLYGQNLANSEPSITDLNQEPYTLDQHVPLDPPSPDVPYSKLGMSHSVTDLMLEGMELPDSPLSSQPSPQEALPYSRFGLRRNPAPYQKSPYVTMGMALHMGAPKDPNQLLSSKNGPAPLVLKSPSKKKQQPAEVSPTSDEAYSKIGLGSVVEQEGQQKSQPYLTMKEVQENEQNRWLPDLTVSSREESPTDQVPNQIGPSDETSKSGYLPHQFIPSVMKAPEPALPDLVNCSSISSLTAVLQEMPEVKVQGNNGYVSLNQVLANNTSV